MKAYMTPKAEMIALCSADILTGSDNYESDIFFENSNLIVKN